MSKIYVKDPGSALTHGIGMIAAVIATPLLLFPIQTRLAKYCLSIFMISMILLYGASTIYHTLDIGCQGNKILRKIDHTMIYLLIAGTYTPVCLLGIGGSCGKWLLAVVWCLAFVGIIFNLFWIQCPKWVSSLIYIGLGWSCIPLFSTILKVLPTGAFIWLLLGGIIYTIGGVIYALKLPLFKNRFPYFGIHELFHLFVMGGSFCHYMLMYLYLI